MKAWQFTGTNQPLQLNEVPEPVALPGTVVVDVKAAGICHSDVSSLTDPTWMALYSELPRTLGHESAGVISSVGEGMEAWNVGDRVGLAPLMSDGQALGYHSWDGGFAPKMLATDDNLVRLPDEVSFELGAMATDAGLTAYGAVMTTGGCKAGMNVGIIGLGGLGYIGARVAALTGATVYGADISEGARGLADEIGLSGVSDSMLDFKDKNLDLVVDFAGFDTTTRDGLEALTKFGVCVLVGMGRPTTTLNIMPIITGQLQLRGSNSGTKADLAALYGLMRSGQLNPPMNLITHAEIPSAIEQLEKGGVVGRYIAQYA